MTDRVWRERGLRDAVAAGDERAWRAWYEEEYAPLEAYVLWRCGSRRDLADEVLQETWMTAVRNVRRFNPHVGNFHAWLCGIAANVIRNHLRSHRRRAERQRALTGDLAVADEALAERERADRVAAALAALSGRYEVALRLKYLDRMTVAEMAATLGETDKAVESLLSRARTAFREAYGDD
ncbi:MAG TPA: sigma-70 family RNA polymerase sigma factor [Gemmataceae bacterium]|nr:sigma-70 family RNA polymerase sigma factor [Gemmataceae bacterium]